MGLNIWVNSLVKRQEAIVVDGLCKINVYKKKKTNGKGYNYKLWIDAPKDILIERVKLKNEND
jgi:hypothetical protein